MSNLQIAIWVLVVVIVVQMCATALPQLQGASERLMSIRRKSQAVIPLPLYIGSFLESNPFLEQRWKLPILYYIDSTHDAKTRDSIQKSISYWQSVTCARFEEVTNRTQVMTSPSLTKYVIFTASRVIGRQCITNVFSREHIGLAVDEDDADIYQRVAGCLTLTATRQTDVRVGSTFYFYLNEQLPPFNDDFLEAINVTESRGTHETKVKVVSEVTENNDLVGMTSLYRLPGLSFDQMEAINSVYCEDCKSDEAENSTGCKERCQLPTANVYANDGCKETPPPIDSDCNITRTVTGKEECVSSPSLSFGLPRGQPRAWCPWHLEGRDGCRVRITYTGRLLVARPCGRNTGIRVGDSTQQKNQRDGLKLNSSRQTRDTRAKSCSSEETRIGVNGTLLSSRRSASVIFRTRYAPDDETNATTTSSSSSSSRGRGRGSASGRGGPSRQAQTDNRKAGQFHLQFTVCFRLVCDEFIRSSGPPPDMRPAAGPDSAAKGPSLQPTSRPLLVRRTSPRPAERIQPMTTTPFFDIRLFHLEQTSPPQIHLQHDRVVSDNETEQSGR